MEVRTTFAQALPNTTSLHLDTWDIDDAHAQITLLISSTQTAARCPGWNAPAQHVHSRYTRTLADLPWSGDEITWQLRVRRLFCRNSTCPRRIFTERLPGIAAPWARRTVQRYLQSPTFPERLPRRDRDRSCLDPYKPVLLAGWNNGCRNGTHLCRGIKCQGFHARYGIVPLYVQRLLQAQGLAPRQRRSDHPLLVVTAATRRLLTPRCATWLVLRPPDQCAEDGDHLLARLSAQFPTLAEAVALA
jgi:hypothetical protein